MRTIADSYIEEGFNKGILQGIEKEENKKAIEIAKAMLLDGYAIEKISKITTGLTVEGIEKLK